MGAILLATDGSEYARRAAAEAIDLAAARDVPLYVLCVVDQRRFDDPALGAAELATIYAEDHAVLTVEEVTALAAGEAVAVDGDTRHGVPEEVILEYAAEVDADVIVVGEHGDHAEHFSGVGRRVSKLADREVVVVDAAT
ncbi:universal stress protein [Salinirubellus salinus]|jgi:nucleotide-binding universal stress UspA family protein|uniref:Universal stress protein n=1 Tax=Salinirubellus salinus TaxID=1364945 RepID=A0A9E7U3J7_9EURY|nr:universal stress protein [Salinirubellus salinus]UWM53325.1 universal stress protein [Salinirubellus salinus]